MRVLYKSFPILGAIFAISPMVSCSSSPWASFLRQPNEESLLKVKGFLGDSHLQCRVGNPSNPNVAPSEQQDRLLFNLVAGGNEFALRAALLVFQCMDGGELEDFSRSVGKFFELQPAKFLELIAHSPITDSQLERFLVMLPLDAADDIDRKISLIQKRVTLLNSVDPASPDGPRRRALALLLREEEDLKRIQAGLEEK